MKNKPHFRKDSRIVMLDDVSDFSLMRDFKGGVLCPHDPFTKEDEAEIDLFIARHISTTPYAYRDMSFEIYDNQFNSPGNPIPVALKKTVDLTRKILTNITGVESESYIRLNSRFPEKSHKHPGEFSITYTYNGVATIGRNRFFREYETPLRHIFAFDGSMAHRASEYVSADKPKITIITLPRP